MNTTKIILTEKQYKWLDKHFPNTKNDILMEKLGLKHSTFHRIARERGLKKTKQFIKKCQAYTTQKAIESHLLNGTYPPKGYIIPRSEEFRFQKGVTPRERLGTRRNNKRIQKSAESRRATIRKEKARVAFGLPQKTKMKVVSQSRERIELRWYLKKRGYIVDDEKRIVYYTGETKRGKIIENKPQPWYQFQPLTEKVI